MLVLTLMYLIHINSFLNLVSALSVTTTSDRRISWRFQVESETCHHWIYASACWTIGGWILWWKIKCTVYDVACWPWWVKKLILRSFDIMRLLYWAFYFFNVSLSYRLLRKMLSLVNDMLIYVNFSKQNVNVEAILTF